MIAAIFAVATVVAAPQELPLTYTILCQSKINVGMDWHGGEWVASRYAPESYIVSKSPENNCLSLRPPFSAFGIVYKSVCINIRKVGDAFSQSASQACDEVYKATVDIECVGIHSTMKLRPEGEFEMSRLQDNLSSTPPNDYKDSQFVESGTCSLVK